MIRAILSVVKGDSNSRGRALKALSLIVDEDPSVLADVCPNNAFDLRNFISLL